VIGFLFILGAVLRVVITEEERTIALVEPMKFVNWILLVFGSALIIAGIWLYIIAENISRSKKMNAKKSIRFKKVSDDQYSIEFVNAMLNVIYGTIDNIEKYDETTLVILPANDKFDDDCINDERSTLGAFVKSLYTNKDEFKAELEKLAKSKVKKAGGVFKIGEFVYMPSIGKKQLDVGIVAVTHRSKNGSIDASPENVMLAFNTIFDLMKQTRPSKVFIPLIGSGHGGLSPQLSFVLLLISFVRKLRIVNLNGMEVNVIIYKKGSNRSIEPKDVENDMEVVLNLLNVL
jgi:hypothetical protein